MTAERPRRPSRPPKRDAPLLHLSDEVTGELKATARPGKGEILVQVFAQAATAFARGDFEEAITLGEQAKHIALRAAGPRELLGLAYYRSGHYREAARELSAFRRITGSDEQNPVIADCYRAQSKPDKALEIAEAVGPGTSEPVRYEAAIVAAGALKDLGRLDDAIARLERLELDPPTAQEHHLRVWYVLGDLLERRGRFTQALALFDAVSDTEPGLTDADARARGLRKRR